MHCNTLLKGSQNGRQHEEEEVSSYTITLRKKRMELERLCTVLLSLENSRFIKEKRIRNECLLLSAIKWTAKDRGEGGNEQKI